MKKVVLLLIILLLTACSSKWEYKPIENINDLEGRNVGLMMGYETDYFLTGRQDMTIYRYEAIADMLMAINYDKIDCFAVDSMSWKLIEASTTGLEKVEPPFVIGAYVAIFSPDNSEMRDEFNEFMEDFMKTDTYKDILDRIANFDGETYEDPGIELTGTGKTIKLGYLAEGFPRSFMDIKADKALGFDVEVFEYFANAYNYQLDFYASSYENTESGVLTGIYDAGIGYFSSAYVKEMEATGYNPSVSFNEEEFYFVQKTEPSITSDLEEE